MDIFNPHFQLNTDLKFEWNNFDAYPVDTYGEKWSENSGAPIYLCVHKITKLPWITGSFIHASNDVPIWNEVVLSFQSCIVNGIFAAHKPLLAYGTGGRVYTGFMLIYDIDVQKYKILCFPENTALKNMTHSGEVIVINSL